jgi:Rrf2 family iron-sulfur cluster assembly transcriptional regulator
MRLSLQVQYAICGVFDLAYNGEGEPVQIRVISARQGVPARYLEQIFRRLRRAGIISAKRGPGGGYSLAREASRITLRQMIEAVEGPLDEALQMKGREVQQPGDYRPDFLWSQLATRLAAALDETTVESLCQEATRRGVPHADAEAPMYFI